MQGQQIEKTQIRLTNLPSFSETQTQTVQPQADFLGRLSPRVSSESIVQAYAFAINQAIESQPLRAQQSLLRLQRQYGNRYVQRVLALAREGQGEAEVTPNVESAIERARGGGQALDHSARTRMESAFGTDFGGVRIHTGAESHSLNRAVNAVAFTTGQDIFFSDGAYNPSSSNGQQLLAHELTHVVQQSGSQIQTKLVVGEPDDLYEQEANLVAKTIVTSPSFNDSSSGSLQRQCACGGRTASGGECEKCQRKREAIDQSEASVLPNFQRFSSLIRVQSSHFIQRQQGDLEACNKKAMDDSNRCTNTGSTYCNRIQILGGTAGGALGAGIGGVVGGGFGGAAVGGTIGAAAGAWMTSDCGAKLNRICANNLASAQQKCTAEHIPDVNVEDLPEAPPPDVNVEDLPEAQ